MQSGSRATVVFASILTSSLVFAQPAKQANADLTPSQRYEQLTEATRLDRKGALPFHLKMDAQLYDLMGKPAERGTIEEWWAAPDEYRIELKSGSLHQATASGRPDADQQDTRTSYLLDELLDQAVQPLGMLVAGDNITSTTRQFGETKLECFRTENRTENPPSSVALCTEPGTDNLRVEELGTEVIVRNSVGTFRGTHVALAIKIAYLGHDVISGKVTTLESFTPDGPGTPVLRKNPDEAPSAAASGVKAPGVIAGHLTSKVAPVYPLEAREARIGGTVLLRAIISRQGTIRALFVLASPDSSLTQAAMEAVHQWRYTPYLLNGQPAEVDTTITVNFNLNR